MRAQEKEKQAAEGPWKVKKKAPVGVSPFESTSSPASSKTPSKTPSRAPPRAPSRAGLPGPNVGVGISTVGNSSATATSSFASDFYAASQPVTALSLAEIRERQERSTQKAKNVKTIEEIQQEEMFQKWWDAEVARNKGEESRGPEGGPRGTPSKSSRRPNKKKNNNKGPANGSSNGGGGGSGSQDDNGKRHRPRPREQIKA